MANITKKQKIGRLGEDIAIKYLENKGFSIITLNYLKKCGEIDIIAKKAPKLYFIEVKTVSHEKIRENNQNFANSGKHVIHETDNYHAEDNIHEYKVKRLLKTIQLYLIENYPNTEPSWQLDAVTVQLDIKARTANVKYIENIGF